MVIFASKFHKKPEQLNFCTIMGALIGVCGHHKHDLYNSLCIKISHNYDCYFLCSVVVLPKCVS